MTDCARYTHQKRTEPLSFATSNTSIVRDAGSLFQVQMKHEAHLHCGLYWDKRGAKTKSEVEI